MSQTNNQTEVYDYLFAGINPLTLVSAKAVRERDNSADIGLVAGPTDNTEKAPKAVLFSPSVSDLITAPGLEVRSDITEVSIVADSKEFNLPVETFGCSDGYCNATPYREWEEAYERQLEALDIDLYKQQLVSDIVRAKNTEGDKTVVETERNTFKTSNLGASIQPDLSVISIPECKASDWENIGGYRPSITTDIFAPTELEFNAVVENPILYIQETEDSGCDGNVLNYTVPLDKKKIFKAEANGKPEEDNGRSSKCSEKTSQRTTLPSHRYFNSTVCGNVTYLGLPWSDYDPASIGSLQVTALVAEAYADWVTGKSDKHFDDLFTQEVKPRLVPRIILADILYSARFGLLEEVLGFLDTIPEEFDSLNSFILHIVWKIYKERKDIASEMAQAKDSSFISKRLSQLELE